MSGCRAAAEVDGRDGTPSSLTLDGPPRPRGPGHQHARPHSWYAPDEGGGAHALASIPEPYQVNASSDVSALISPPSRRSATTAAATIVSVHNPKSAAAAATTTVLDHNNDPSAGQQRRKFELRFIKTFIHGSAAPNKDHGVAAEVTAGQVNGGGGALANGDLVSAADDNLSNGVQDDDSVRGLLKSSSASILINKKPILKANKSAGSLLLHHSHQNGGGHLANGHIGSGGLVSSVSAADLAQLNRRLLRSAVPLLRHNTVPSGTASGGAHPGAAASDARVNSMGDLTLRNSMGENGRCSRCSSLLSMASGGSRYSLAQGGGGFVSVDKLSQQPPSVPRTPITCKLCLADTSEVTKLAKCGCVFCTECMRSYVRFEILSGAYSVSCPDAECPAKGACSLGQAELRTLGGPELLHKHNQYRLNREIDLDHTRTWCPRAGCETVCAVAPPADSATPPAAAAAAAVAPPAASRAINTPRVMSPPPVCAVQCPTCSDEFCSSCKKQWHPGQSCEQHLMSLGVEEGFPLLLEGPGGSDLIKSCPLCAVPIEKDEGCAQMMCKRCKHVFCWYCLTSLDDDFLLRHYDKGPCKNKLGHSRASVIWHRTQVIGIFAGFGILLLVASPLLLLAAPCIVCCKCRVCNGAARLEQDEDDQQSEDAITGAAGGADDS